MKKTTDVPIFGVDPNFCRADGTPAPIDRDALQRIADTMNSRILDGFRTSVTSGNTRNPDDDGPDPDILGYVDRVWVEGDRLLADISWRDEYKDQVAIRKHFTPEVWTFKTGEQYIDPVVAHATRKEISPRCSWIPKDDEPSETEKLDLTAQP